MYVHEDRPGGFDEVDADAVMQALDESDDSLFELEGLGDDDIAAMAGWAGRAASWARR